MRTIWHCVPMRREVEPLKEGAGLHQVHQGSRGHGHVQAPAKVKVTQPIQEKLKVIYMKLIHSLDPTLHRYPEPSSIQIDQPPT